MTVGRRIVADIWRRMRCRYLRPWLAPASFAILAILLFVAFHDQGRTNRQLRQTDVSLSVAVADLRAAEAAISNLIADRHRDTLKSNAAITAQAARTCMEVDAIRAAMQLTLTGLLPKAQALTATQEAQVQVILGRFAPVQCLTSH
jgi:uncharacterized protein involved in exopolysaccharide biosynthesis